MAKTMQTKLYTATEETYRKYANKVHNVNSEMKELRTDIKIIKRDAVKDGCNLRVLNALIKIDSMRDADKDALTDALEM